MVDATQEMLLNKSKVKEQTDINVSEEYIEALSEHIRVFLLPASQSRAERNGRKTLKAQDV